MTDKPAESAVERVIGFAYAGGLDPWVFDMRDATSHRLDELYVFGDLGELAELSVLSLRINCIIWASEASRIREVKRQRDAAIAELKAENAAAEAALANMIHEKDCCVDIIRDYEQATEKGMDFATAVTLKSVVGHAEELQAKLAAAEAQVEYLADPSHVVLGYTKEENLERARRRTQGKSQ